MTAAPTPGHRPIDRLVAAVADHDAAAFAACLHPDVEWFPLSVVFGDGHGPAALHGRDAVNRWFADTQGVGYHVSATVHEQCGPDHAIVALHVGRGSVGASASASTVTVYGVFSYVDGLVRTARTASTDEAARAAVRSARAAM